MRCKANVKSTENFSQRRLARWVEIGEELIFLVIKYLLVGGVKWGEQSDKLLQTETQKYFL